MPDPVSRTTSLVCHLVPTSPHSRYLHFNPTFVNSDKLNSSQFNSTMVTTRSRGNSAKHEAPKAESELPTKKRKTSKTTKNEIEANGKPDENIEEPVPEVLNSLNSHRSDMKKPETANGNKENNEQDGKPPAAEPEAAKAEDITAGHAPRDSSQAEYIPVLCPRGHANFTSRSPILEKGVFYFFFRPRVNVEDISSINDVQRSYLLLRPLKKSDVESASKDLRMILIPKKQLPSTGTHERFLGFVGSPDEHIKDLKDDIGENTYNTATRGERTQGAARPVAEGVYAIVGDPDGRTTHFAYLLTVPSHASEVQKEFGISDKGSFIMSTRNPATPAPPQAKGLQSAEYPEKYYFSLKTSI